MKVASRFKRFIAYMIDNFLLYVCVSMPVMALFKLIYKNDVENLEMIDLYQPYVISATITTFIICMLYFAFFESSKYQATLGKMLFKLNVMTTNHNKLKFFESCLRFIYIYIPVVPILIVSTYYADKLQDIDMVAAFIILGSWGLSIILYLVWLIPIYFTKERKCIHDMLSNTRVYAKNKE
jgi:uncharacterized RDD family membrane protein YckC